MRRFLGIALLSILLSLPAGAQEASTAGDSYLTNKRQFQLLSEAGADLASVGRLAVSCYSDGTASFSVELNQALTLSNKQSLSLKPEGQEINVIEHHPARDGETVHRFSGWSTIGCVSTADHLALNLDSFENGAVVSKQIARIIPSAKTVSHYASGYLRNSNGRIGYLNETCYSDGSATFSVFLDGSGVYVKKAQTLTLSPARINQYIVHHTAKSNEFVNQLSGWSTLGCVTTKTALNLDIVSVPPPPSRVVGTGALAPIFSLWSVYARVYWF